MKTLVSILAIFLSLSSGFAQESTVNITVTIENVVSDNGKVLAGLHTADTFMKGLGIQNLESEIKDGKVTLTFENVPSGTYAIMAMHDANDNKRMDYQDNGMPKESYGMSGNDMSFGPPNFEMAKFEVGSENLTFNIRF